MALLGPSANETGHDYAPIRSWLAYGGAMPADPESFYRENGKGADFGNQGIWRLADAVAAGHPHHGIAVGDGTTAGNFSWLLIMFGTNDIGYEDWTAESWKAMLQAYLEATIALGVVPVVSTIPPHADHVEDGLVLVANAAIREVALALQIPYVDYYALILHYQPQDWHGTLIAADGRHPSAGGGGGDSSSSGSPPPTATRRVRN